MSNLIDRLGDYFDSKGKTSGQRYTRCLIVFFHFFCLAGFIVGLMLELGLRALRICGGQP